MPCKYLSRLERSKRLQTLSRGLLMPNLDWRVKFIYKKDNLRPEFLLFKSFKRQDSMHSRNLYSQQSCRSAFWMCQLPCGLHLQYRYICRTSSSCIYALPCRQILCWENSCCLASCALQQRLLLSIRNSIDDPLPARICMPHYRINCETSNRRSVHSRLLLHLSFVKQNSNWRNHRQYLPSW